MKLRSCKRSLRPWSLRAYQLSFAPEALNKEFFCCFLLLLLLLLFFLPCLIFYRNVLCWSYIFDFSSSNFRSRVNIYIFFLWELTSDEINFSGEEVLWRSSAIRSPTSLHPLLLFRDREGKPSPIDIYNANTLTEPSWVQAVRDAYKLGSANEFAQHKKNRTKFKCLGREDR